MLLHDGKQTGQIIHEQAQTVEFVNLDLSLPDTNDLLKWKQYCRNKKKRRSVPNFKSSKQAPRRQSWSPDIPYMIYTSECF